MRRSCCPARPLGRTPAAGTLRSEPSSHTARARPPRSTASSEPLVVRRRRAEDDPLELGDRAATDARGGLEALGSEVAAFEHATQVVERRAILLAHDVAGALDEQQV